MATKIVIQIRIMINYRDFPRPFYVQNSQKNDIKKSGFIMIIWPEISTRRQMWVIVLIFLCNFLF